MRYLVKWLDDGPAGVVYRMSTYDESIKRWDWSTRGWVDSPSLEDSDLREVSEDDALAAVRKRQRGIAKTAGSGNLEGTSGAPDQAETPPDHQTPYDDFVERECPRCGGRWLEPAGISTKYNVRRKAFVEYTASFAESQGGDFRHRGADDQPWEDFVSDEMGDVQNWLICAKCVSDEHGRPAEESGTQWYADGGPRHRD